MPESKLFTNRVYITPKIFVILCPEGERLYEQWLLTLAMHAAPEVIYKAMQAYFLHRNGIIRGNYSKNKNTYCQECSSWLQERAS